MSLILFLFNIVFLSPLNYIPKRKMKILINRLNNKKFSDFLEGGIYIQMEVQKKEGKPINLIKILYIELFFISLPPKKENFHPSNEITF